MNLYLISQTENTGYDTYDSAVVAALSENGARRTLPSEGAAFNDTFCSTWASSPEKVSVRYLGKAARGIKAGVIFASFNAG